MPQQEPEGGGSAAAGVAAVPAVPPQARKATRQAVDHSRRLSRAAWPLAHPDWLYHRLAISGPDDQVAGFRAAGAGLIPWQLDLDRHEQDPFHLLVAPPPPQQPSLSVTGARMLAGQLRAAVAHRHGLAMARVGHSRACPFDLHALLPVPADILRLGPDHPDALAWLWEHWGTPQALRHVRADLDRPSQTMVVTFWSADWTPWRALRTLAGLGRR